MKFIFIICLICCSTGVAAQKAGGEVLLSLKSRQKITVFTTEGGQVRKASMGHNLKKEDFLIVKILAATKRRYYVKLYYCEADDSAKGWINRNENLVIFNKKNDTLVRLYQNPSNNAIAKDEKYDNGELKVIDFSNDWLKVVIYNGKERRTGWLSPRDQWSNPYTTCN